MSCLFCKIIKKEIPCMTLLETEKSLAFLDIGPLSDGHALVIPKMHAEKLDQLTPEYAADLLPTALKVVKRYKEMGLCHDYNILQNNGKIAHQEVNHVHVHIIPKTESEGLGITWDIKQIDRNDLSKFAKLFQQK
eukprot:NODE_39_length_35218_cov_0.479655.p34 type:complete len:135 gc:universal NODE_39_length_35218_cov_0.479655:21397-21801(+)